ncbi:unnamed protein product [Ambrosiozyma monospora]|uniref:Unnamed protein product n=1 Tax=Ambrosiozyma monospora TaxID=43982 RepID=A0ACB5TC13_AMBMO|nr:unnamed protein product [Ambrosiozyma monospora]
MDDVLQTLTYMGILFVKGEKSSYVDYYKESYKTRDTDIYLEDGRFNVTILKAKVEEWANHNRPINGAPILDKEKFILY